MRWLVLVLVLLFVGPPARSQQFSVEMVTFQLQEIATQEVAFRLPLESRILSVGEHATQPTLWVLRSDNPKIVTYRCVVLKGASQPHDPVTWSRYIGTFDYLSDSYHLFAKDFKLRMVENATELTR